LLARELGVEPERVFEETGIGGRLKEPRSSEEIVSLVREKLGREPLAFRYGPEPVRTVAIVTGGGGPSLLQAAREGYDLFLTGEPKEPSLHVARELGIHFLAAGSGDQDRRALRYRVGVRRAPESGLGAYPGRNVRPRWSSRGCQRPEDCEDALVVH
jgi:putative NIF3 family GTP cyclohydrolase 1 type 2